MDAISNIVITIKHVTNISEIRIYTFIMNHELHMAYESHMAYDNDE